MDDPKCMLMIDQLGMEGYGIFWGLIERLRQEKDYKLPTSVLPSLAKRWGTSAEKVQTVVSKYGLFIMEDDGFFSARLRRSMIEKSENGRNNALKRWGNATALPLHSNRNADPMQNDASKVKESKVKESKVKVLPTPSLLEIKDYCIERNNKVSPEKFFDYYTSNGWKVGRNSMKDWRAAVRNWEKSSFDKPATHNKDNTLASAYDLLTQKL